MRQKNNALVWEDLKRSGGARKGSCNVMDGAIEQVGTPKGKATKASLVPPSQRRLAQTTRGEMGQRWVGSNYATLTGEVKGSNRPEETEVTQKATHRLQKGRAPRDKRKKDGGLSGLPRAGATFSFFVNGPTPDMKRQTTPTWRQTSSKMTAEERNRQRGHCGERPGREGDTISAKGETRR